MFIQRRPGILVICSESLDFYSSNLFVSENFLLLWIFLAPYYFGYLRFPQDIVSGNKRIRFQISFLCI